MRPTPSLRRYTGRGVEIAVGVMWLLLTLQLLLLRVVATSMTHSSLHLVRHSLHGLALMMLSLLLRLTRNVHLVVHHSMSNLGLLLLLLWHHAMRYSHLRICPVHAHRGSGLLRLGHHLDGHHAAHAHIHGLHWHIHGTAVREVDQLRSGSGGVHLLLRLHLVLRLLLLIASILVDIATSALHRGRLLLTHHNHGLPSGTGIHHRGSTSGNIGLHLFRSHVIVLTLHCPRIDLILSTKQFIYQSI